MNGGIGIIHANFKTIQEQVSEILKVKRYKQGFITNPQCIGPDNTIFDLMNIKIKYGFTGTPVTSTGKVGGKLLGFFKIFILKIIILIYFLKLFTLLFFRFSNIT